MISTPHFLGNQANVADAIPDVSRGDPAYSMDAAQLLQFGLSPRRWVERAPDDDPEASLLSTMVRLFLLEPGRVAESFIARPREYTAQVNTCPKCGSVAPGQYCRKDAAKRRIVPVVKPWAATATFCANWTAEQEKRKKQVVHPDRWDEAAAAAGKLLSDPDTALLLEQSDRLGLYTGMYEDPETGIKVPLHAQVDLAPRPGESLDATLAQVVVTRDASHASWARTLWNSGRYVEAALIRELHGAATGDTRAHYLWCIVESTPPFLVARRRAAPELLTTGINLANRLLAAYAGCLARGDWPAFDVSAPGSINAWSQVFWENWMTQGVGGDQAYFALATPAAPAA